MPPLRNIAILSDVHYASDAEKARGEDYEYSGVNKPFLKWMMRNYRRHLWLRSPLSQNIRLDQFLERVGNPDWVVANGDYSCDSAFVGLSDDASLQSAKECLGKLSARFGNKLLATAGDHEFGKLSFVGAKGGMRLASWERGQRVLGLKSFWRCEIGNYVLMGVTSSLIAIKLFEPDMLSSEREQWLELSARHMDEIRAAFDSLGKNQRVILFCHDPSALPILWHEEKVRSKLGQVEQTIVGHLHSRFIMAKSKILAGMPRIPFLGYTARRMTTALSEARHWRPFKVRLCPSLAGIELLKDGGYYTVEIDQGAVLPAKFTFHPLPR